MAKKWTPLEEKFLLENYGKVPMAELADKFSVTRKAVSAKLDKLRQTHGIDPAGARERVVQKVMAGKMAASANTPIPGGAVPRPIPQREDSTILVAENIKSDTPQGKVNSGFVVKTDKGWHPIFVDKKRVTN